MKAITLYQPWATLVALGAKKIETRSWGTKYRGPLAIHAGSNKKFIEGFDSLIWEDYFHDALSTEDFDIKRDSFPLGKIVAVCQLIDCLTIGPKFNLTLSPQEKAFGDYSYEKHRWAWILSDIQKLSHPVPIKGQMGLWEWHEKRL